MACVWTMRSERNRTHPKHVIFSDYECDIVPQKKIRMSYVHVLPVEKTFDVDGNSSKMKTKA